MQYLYTFIFLALFSSSQLFAQYQITGKLKPVGEQKSILMYKTEGAFQYYKASAPVDEKGMFGFILPENFEVGNYKLVYDAQKDLAINVIYNNENISMVFDPKNAINSIFFYESENNTLFYDYIQTISKKYNELESIQKVYYENKTDSVLKKFVFKRGEIKAFQDHFEKQASNQIAHSFITAFKKPLTKQPFSSKDEKYQFLRENYIQNINFQDTILRNSAFLIDRLNEYVFDLNEALAKTNNNVLEVKMIDDALALIEKSTFKDEVIYSLTSSSFDPYSAKYDNLLDHLFNQYYQKLPEEAKNSKFTDMVIAKLNAIVGRKAPNIELDSTNLYSLKSDSTLVIFWSTTCSHCLVEIPKVYKMLADNKSLKVVLVGIEEEYSDWENISKGFPKWINKRANGKFKNKNAIAYNIKSTPAYFLLDNKKMIIAKPDKLVDLEHIFKK